MITITAIDRDGDATELQLSEGGSLMEALRDNGLGIDALCGGCCSCATCHCYLDDDSYDRLGGPAPDEEDLLNTLEHREARSRLTCQIMLGEACDGLVVTVAPAE